MYWGLWAGFWQLCLSLFLAECRGAANALEAGTRKIDPPRRKKRVFGGQPDFEAWEAFNKDASYRGS